MKGAESSSLILIDGMNFLWRSFSVPFRFESRRGTPLHVATMFLKLLRNTYNISTSISGTNNLKLVCLFDTQTSIKTRRNSYSAYKANRKEFKKDDETPYQYLEQIFLILNYLGISYHKCRDYEADDAIAVLSKRHVQNNKGNDSYIYSTDTDFYQVIQLNISQVRFKRGNDYEVVTPQTIKEKLNISPKNYVYYKALKGDSSDNIEGIPGIGKVRAAKIINQEMEFNLIKYKGIVERNKQLIRFREDIEVDNKHSESAFNPKLLTQPNKDIFKDCGF